MPRLLRGRRPTASKPCIFISAAVWQGVQQGQAAIMFHYLSRDKVYAVLPRAGVRMSETDERHYMSAWSALLTRKPYPFLQIR